MIFYLLIFNYVFVANIIIIIKIKITHKRIIAFLRKTLFGGILWIKYVKSAGFKRKGFIIMQFFHKWTFFKTYIFIIKLLFSFFGIIFKLFLKKLWIILYFLRHLAILIVFFFWYFILIYVLGINFFLFFYSW
jgi:hypothetical protein